MAFKFKQDFDKNLRQVWLVTGGAGFIGSNFIRAALAHFEGDADAPFLLNLDKLTYAGNEATISDLESNPNYGFCLGDICDEKLLDELFTRYHISKVINFAAESHVDRSIDSAEAFLQTNILGTFRLLEAARKHWNLLSDEQKTSRRFLHVSTDEVYGSLSVADPAFHEKTAYSPNSPYSATKAASDHLVRAWHHTYNLPTITTNCSNNYGPYQFPEKLIPLSILNAIDGKPLPIYGDGQNIRDWLFVEDHCSAILTILEKGKLGETYNIGGRHEKTNLEIITSLCSALDKLLPLSAGRTYKSQITFVQDRPGHDRRYAINCEKIEKEFNWKPKETFQSGLEKTVRWYLANRDWCKAVSQNKYERERLGLSNGLSNRSDDCAAIVDCAPLNQSAVVNFETESENQLEKVA